MTTKASLKALTSLPNQDTRWTHRRIAHNALKGCELTIREVAAKVRKPYNAMQKRISELLEDEMIVECGEKDENGQANSIYKHNPNPPTEKKPTFIQYAKTREDWKHQYRAEIHHELL